MGDESEKNIHVLGIEGKRWITVVVPSSINGKLLPLQIIFTWSTIKCLLPKIVRKLYSIIH
jgi:hypothetical protein